jgi:hypothetical protein
MVKSKTSTLLDKKGPFGDPDASRVNFKDLQASYVNLSEYAPKRNEYLGADASIRIIVGRRGSGKTLYLRGIQNYCQKQGLTNIYVTKIDNQPPDTSLVVKVTSWYEDNEKHAEETWRSICHKAILRSVYTHLFFSEDLEKYVQGRKQNILDDCKHVIPNANSPHTVLEEMKIILGRYNSPKDLEAFLNREEWTDFENQIAMIMRKTPPMYFFIDQLDDDFANAPFHWLKCQFGLFEAIFRFIRDDNFAEKLHITVCIREVVYSYILQTPQGNKYLAEPKIKILKWDMNLAQHFLNKKIKSLDDKYFPEGTKLKTAEKFFGVSGVHLRRQAGAEQDIRSYVLRHTMLLPREIINIGNMFCERRPNIEFEGDAERESEFEVAIKETVSIVANSLAQEQLNMAAILICNKWIYNGAVEEGNHEIFRSETMLRPIIDGLCGLIRSIGKDRFTQRLLNRVHTQRKNFGFGAADDPFTTLFRTGLLGYVEGNADGHPKERFFSESRKAPFRLPTQKEKYVFHSCLIDHLGIKPIGAPVNA